MLWLCLLLFADQFDAQFQAGLIALNGGRLAIAESELESASRLRPENPRVWLALAQTYRKLGKQDLAEAAAMNAQTHHPDAVVLHGLGLYYSEAGQFPKAVESLAAAIRQSPYQESYYFDLAQLHLNRQEFAAALAILDKARLNFDKSAQLELAAGVAYYGLRRFPEAIDAFLRTAQLSPDAEQPYVFLGRMLDQAESRLAAITQAFAAYARRAPESDVAAYLYGKSLAAAGDTAAAEPWLRKSIARNAGFWESHYELGLLLDQEGKLEDAANEIRTAIQLHPGDPAPHYRLARLYTRLGKPAEAQTERDLHARLTAAGQAAAGIK